MDSTILLWSLWPVFHCLCLCLLIPSSLLIQIFHNTSSTKHSNHLEVINFDSQHVPCNFLNSQHAKAELLVMSCLSVPPRTCRLSTPLHSFLAQIQRNHFITWGPYSLTRNVWQHCWNTFGYFPIKSCCMCGGCIKYTFTNHWKKYSLLLFFQVQ